MFSKYLSSVFCIFLHEILFWLDLLTQSQSCWFFGTEQTQECSAQQQRMHFHPFRTILCNTANDTMTLLLGLAHLPHKTWVREQSGCWSIDLNYLLSLLQRKDNTGKKWRLVYINGQQKWIHCLKITRTFSSPSLRPVSTWTLPACLHPCHTEHCK